MHLLLNVKVHEWVPQGRGMLHRNAIETWTDDKWGQQAIQIAEWLIETISSKPLFDCNVEHSLLMEQSIKQIICNVKIIFTYRSINGILVLFKPREQEIQAFGFAIVMLKSRCQHVSEHPNGDKHSLRNGLWNNAGKKHDQKVLNNVSQQFVVQRPVLNAILNNQILTMLKNSCS